VYSTITISSLFSRFTTLVWGIPLILLLVGTGLFLTCKLKLIQVRGFFHAVELLFGNYDNPSHSGEISHF
jgi:AGCS family alanine or glycine:cation symporter